MILKTFEIKKKKILGKFLLFHGNNQGFKDDIINEVILENFDGEILRYEETEVIINQDNFISNLKNDSLFAKKKNYNNKQSNRQNVFFYFKYCHSFFKRYCGCSG